MAWVERVHINFEGVLGWRLYDETVREALIDAAALGVPIPEGYRDSWIAADVYVAGEDFVVVLEAEGGEEDAE